MGDKPGSQVVLETKTAPKKGSTGQRGSAAMPASLPVRRPFGASGQVKALWLSAEATRYSKALSSLPWVLGCPWLPKPGNPELPSPPRHRPLTPAQERAAGWGGRSGGARGSLWGALGGIEGRQPKDVESFPKKNLLKAWTVASSCLFPDSSLTLGSFFGFDGAVFASPQKPARAGKALLHSDSKLRR